MKTSVSRRGADKVYENFKVDITCIKSTKYWIINLLIGYLWIKLDKN